MQVGIYDMEPVVAEAFANQVGTLLWSTQSTPEQETLRTVLAKRGSPRAGWQLGLTFASFPMIMAAAQFGDTNTAAFLALLAAAFATMAGGLWVGRRQPDLMTQLRQSVTSEEMAAVFPLLQLSPAERVYAEALQTAASLKPGADDPALREILPQLRQLVEQSRQLEAQRERVRAAMSSHSEAPLEHDRAEFARQLHDATDPVVRQALQQSLQSCESRLDDARQFAAVLQRLNAQQEMILQTLSSLQSSLARRGLGDAALAAPDLGELQEAVSRVTRDNQAIDKAMQEVVTLRVG
jgi:hypothetical protein